MKKILFSLSLFILALTVQAQGLKKIAVEKYYVASGLDAASGFLPAGAVTYRIYAEMQPGFFFVQAFGTSDHILSMTTNGTFFNADNGDNKPGFTAANVKTDLNALDSYLSTGNALKGGNLAVDKSEDTNGSVLATAPLLKNTDPTIGIPLFTQDGIVPGSAPDFNVSPGLDVTAFDGGSAVNNFTIASGSWYSTTRPMGATASNKVLIAQVTTTDGTFHYDINLLINKDLGGGFSQAEYYSYTAPVAADMSSSWTNFSGSQFKLSGTYPIVVSLPTVSIVTNKASYNKGESAVITATAADADGSVDHVDFLVNGSVVNTDNAAPFTYSWPVVGTSAAITAFAYDNDGNKSVLSNTVNVTIVDANPTIVSITSPVAGNITMSPITITASAVDADEPVQSVEFRDGATVIGTDNNGADGWSTPWTPTSGSHSLTAIAKNSVNVPTTSAVVIVTATNALPSVAITAPAAGGFNLTIGNDTTIIATATDADGSVSKVEFFVNGVSAAVDNTPADGFSFNYVGATLGLKSITAVATDNNNGTKTSAAFTFSVTPPVGGAKYQIASTTDFCSSSDVFCVPIKTAVAVSGVTGYDINLVYNKADVTPTDIVKVGNELIANGDYTSYNVNHINDSTLRISIYFNTSAPAGTTFTGAADKLVCCVEFSRNPSFGSVHSTTFKAPWVQESYPTFYNETAAIAGTYNTIKKTEFDGSLSFWSDNSPIAYVAGVNAPTDIFGNVNPATIVHPDAAGNFVYNITNGTSITINRDVDNTFDVQPVISSQDAYLTAKVTVDDASFLPNVYQIIAMDVNRDGRVTAGDISQMQQRTVGHIHEFTQAGGGHKDWVFVPSQTILSDFSYRRSATYPASDNVGFSRTKVPDVADLIALPIDDVNNCPIIKNENYKGVLFGDVTGNYAAQPNSVQLKSASVGEGFVLTLEDKGNNNYNVLVSAASSENINSFDISFDCDKSLTHDSADKKLMNYQGECFLDNNRLKCGGYMTNAFKGGNLVTIPLQSSGPITISNLNVVTSLLNEQKVSAEVKTDATSISNVSANVVKVYPNPATDHLFVEVSENSTIQLFDMSGKEVSIETNVFANESNIINIEGIAAGVYIIKISNKNSVQMKKVVVK